MLLLSIRKKAFQGPVFRSGQSLSGARQPETSMSPRRLHKNGDIDYGPYEGTFKTTFKEDGSWKMTTWEGTYKVTGGTGKFKNAKGSGTDRGKATAQGASEDWEGEREY